MNPTQDLVVSSLKNTKRSGNKNMEDTTHGFGWCAVIKTARNMFSEWISESMLNRKLFSGCCALLDTG